MPDLTPEHTKRDIDGDRHPEVSAAYRYVDSVVHAADARSPFGGHAWHGWALREAFLAGCSHATALAQPEPEGATDEEICSFITRVWPHAPGSKRWRRRSRREAPQ